MKSAGTYVKCSAGGEAFRAFVPAPLPPRPLLSLSADDQDLMEQADRALGLLDGLTKLLPDPSIFLYGYVRKEALLSSQIEGTQSSFADLLLHESHLAPGVPLDDVQEVSNYVAAMNHGLRRLRRDGFPLSLRLIKEIHAVLMAKGRGSRQAPGEFRSSQNWISGTRPGNAMYVPPPWERVQNCMGNLEDFLHDRPRKTPVLIKAALAHVQFETIHPFLDGNGRLGRLLITLILCAQGTLQEPLLYLSLYFKQNRQVYYDLLQDVRLKGNWVGWLRFFLEGVRDTARQAGETAKTILALFDKDRRKIETLGRRAGTVRLASAEPDAGSATAVDPVHPHDCPKPEGFRPHGASLHRGPGETKDRPRNNRKAAKPLLCLHSVYQGVGRGHGTLGTTLAKSGSSRVS